MGFIDQLIELTRMKTNITLARSQATYYIRNYRTTNQIEKTYLTTPEYRLRYRLRYQIKKQAQTTEPTDTITPAEVKPPITFELPSPQTAAT
jgi:hypothetical protein